MLPTGAVIKLLFHSTYHYLMSFYAFIKHTLKCLRISNFWSLVLRTILIRVDLPNGINDPQFTIVGEGDKFWCFFSRTFLKYAE